MNLTTTIGCFHICRYAVFLSLVLMTLNFVQRLLEFFERNAMYCYLTCTKTSQLQNSFSSSSTLADVIRQKKIVTSKKSYMRVDNCFTVLLPSFRICQLVPKDNFFDTSVIKQQLAKNTIAIVFSVSLPFRKVLFCQKLHFKLKDTCESEETT